MQINNAIQIIGQEPWRVTCFDCGHTVDKGCRVRHDAQLAWNGVAHEKA